MARCAEIIATQLGTIWSTQARHLNIRIRSFRLTQKMAKKFSPEEVSVMEGIYQRQNHSTPKQNQQLAQQFGKSSKIIAGWFRSRRRKDVKNGVTLQIHEITNNELHDLRSQLHLYRKRTATMKESKEEPVAEFLRLETIQPTITQFPPADLKNSIELIVKSEQLSPQVPRNENFERPDTPSANLTERWGSNQHNQRLMKL